MEYSFSSWTEDTFVLEFSDERDRMGQTENFGDKEQIRRDSKRRYSSKVMHDYAKVKLDNYCDFKDLRLNRAQEAEHYVTQGFTKKPQTTSAVIKKDYIINVPKLICQLLSAKVVIEKMCENSERDLTSEIKCVLPEGFQLKYSIQRYCPDCKTLKADQREVTVHKFCPKCEAALKYVCSKCNVKQYSHYETLRMHWNKCGQTADTSEELRSSQHQDSIQRYFPKCKTTKADKHRITARKSCPKCKTKLKYMSSKCNSKQCLSYAQSLIHWEKRGQAADTCKKLNPNDFLVGKTEIDYSRDIIRYCSRCDKIEENCTKWRDNMCRNCNHYLLYQCNKCKVQFDKLRGLTYHMQSKCYPSRYECNQCDFTNPIWMSMRRHVENVHFRTKVNCPRCDVVMKHKGLLKIHLKFCGKASNFKCDHCAFNAKYKKSLKCHMKSAHGE